MATWTAPAKKLPNTTLTIKFTKWRWTGARKFGAAVVVAAAALSTHFWG